MGFFVFFAFAVLAGVHCSDDFDDLEVVGESKFVILYSETRFFFRKSDREISSVIFIIFFFYLFFYV